MHPSNCKQEGAFLGKLSHEQWNQLCDLANHLGLEEPNSSRVRALLTCSASQRLTVTFDGNKTCTLEMEEINESPGWDRFRGIIFGLREQVEWHPK